MDRSRINRRANDCEVYGIKHQLYLYKAVDHFLMGQLWFHCYNCHSMVMVDRFWFYQAIAVRGCPLGH